MASTATTFDTDCVLMLHCDGADASTTFTDSSVSAKTVTANGNAQIDTAQSKFGGASGLFDGSGDYLSVADSADWDFGTSDFNIDMWMRQPSFSGQETLIDIGDGQYGIGVTIAFDYNAGSPLIKTYINTTQYFDSIALSVDTWYHFAVTRNGTNLRHFLNGTQIGTTRTNSSNISGSTNGVRVGFSNGDDRPLSGWADEIRVVKGTAVWTANFTPPTAAYTPPSTGHSFALMGVGN